MKEYFEERICDELDADGKVEVAGHTWPNSHVFKNMDEQGYEAHVLQEIEEKKAQAKERAREFLDETECVQRFELLCQKQQRQMVLPFVGAGMSVASGYPLWSDLLRHTTADSPDLRAQVSDFIAEFKYEEAAQAVHDVLGAEALHNDIEAHLGNAGYEPKGPINLLPYCFGSGCITTNLDNLLERVFLASGKRFDAEVWGTRLKDQQGFVPPDENRLFKIHGTATERGGRVITNREYEQTYANDATLETILNHIVANRHLLFLGCSLGVDRTVRALTALFKNGMVQNLQHFAILPLYSDTDRAERRLELGAANITPIWYPKTDDTDHEQCIEDLLICIAEGGLGA
jgi:hypothetical protein